MTFNGEDDLGPATRALAKFASEVRYEDLPPRVVHKTKQVICDTVGCTFGGFMHEIGVITRRYAKALGGVPESRIVGLGERTSCTNAAFVNGSMANALDNDETFFNGSHPAAIAIWAAIPAAERRGSSGKDLIAAVAAGFDVAARICLATETPGVLGHKRKAVSSGSWQTFGAVAAAGRVLGLNPDQMANAFGIAGTYAPMPAQTNWNGQPDRYSLVKYFSTGWSAQVGLSAALLAAEGFTGPLHILDGETGFWRMQGFDECDFDFMLERLGHLWWIEETSFKLWPACRAVHPYLTAFHSIVKSNGLVASDIEQVMAYGHLAPPQAPGAPPTHAPLFGDMHPREPINLQFNLPHPLACIAYGVEAGPRFFAPEIVNSPTIRAFREKVRLVVDPKSLEVLQAQFSGPNPRRARRVPVTVEVRTKSALYRHSVEYSLGDPWSPETVLGDEDLQAKFISNASPLALASPSWLLRIDKIIGMILELDKLDDINYLTRMLVP